MSASSTVPRLPLTRFGILFFLAACGSDESTSPESELPDSATADAGAPSDIDRSDDATPGVDAALPPEEDCEAVGDEDGNGASDCDDEACQGSPSCPEASEEFCRDGIDDDGDGPTDCDDPDCSFDPACAPAAPEVCADGLDNDRNGLTDCSDPVCEDDPACIPVCGNDSRCPETEACFDGLCADPFPRSYVLYAGTVVFALTNPGGGTWDPEGGSPEGVVDFAVDGVRLERGRVCPEGFFCDLSDSRYTVTLNEGATLDIFLGDDDGETTELVKQCTLTVNAELIRQEFYTCILDDLRTYAEIVIAR